MGKRLKALMGCGTMLGLPISVLQAYSPGSNLSFTLRTSSKKELFQIALLRRINSDLLTAVIKSDFLFFQRSKLSIHQSSVQLIQA